MTMQATLYNLRRAGWRVAVHNDYMQDGRLQTFWLMTHQSGIFLKGEGLTDEEALAKIDAQARKVFAPSP